MEDFLTSATLFDIVVVLVAMGMFVAGWLQGAMRGLLSILAFLVAFVIAGQLRPVLGEFLAENWTWYERGFNFMLAFLGLWLAFVVTFQVGIQVFYRRVVLHHRLVVVDEILGGLLGAIQVFLVVSLVAVIFASFYDTLPPNTGAADVGWARSLQDLLKESAVVGALREGFIPALLALLGLFLPAEIVAPTRTS